MLVNIKKYIEILTLLLIMLYLFAATFSEFPKMKSKTLVCVVLCQLIVLTWLTPAQGKGLLSNLMKQAETLSHGLDLASKVGDIGSYIKTCVYMILKCRMETGYSCQSQDNTFAIA